MKTLFSYDLSDLVMVKGHVLKEVLRYYNESLWPYQIVWIILGPLTVFWVLKKKPRASGCLTVYLILSWVFLAFIYIDQFVGPLFWFSQTLFYLAFIQALLLLVFLMTLKTKGIQSSKISFLFLGLGFFPFEALITGSWELILLAGWGLMQTSLLQLSLVMMNGIRRWGIILSAIPILFIGFSMFLFLSFI